MHFKSLHFHSFIHSFIQTWQNTGTHGNFQAGAVTLT